MSAISGDYDATDLQFTRRRYDGYRAYAQSKEALRMLTWDFAERLAGTGVAANAVTPGFVKTGFNRNARGLKATLIGLAARAFAVSPAKGADAPLWVATAPELERTTGRYFMSRAEKDGGPRDGQVIADLVRRCREMVEQATRQSVGS